ncbi:MAG: ABC transporter substrate-binding protein [Deltaproteobacteria bacterium]|nr:ABC transporter substrate-binding protein [Deltaproteobacteria bacterium]
MRAYFLKGSIFLFLTLVMTVPSLAGQPMEQIRKTTDRIIAIVSDPELKPPEKAKERKRLIRQAVDERFDWEEMSRRSLARHWKRMTEEEKKEFIYLFGKLLERTYFEQAGNYSGEKVLYLSETVDETGFGDVRIKIITRQETEIPVRYKVKKNGDGWYVYDVSVEGRSLINNYRKQFQRMPYKKLIKQLRAKVAQ